MEVMEPMIQPPTTSSELVFTELYEVCFPAVAKFVSKRRGSFQDAKDVFHDALVIYHEKRQQTDFNPQISSEAYVLGIARHLWSRKFGDDLRKISVDDDERIFSFPEDFFPTVNENRLLSLLERSGERCLSLLRSFYYELCSMSELKRRFGFQSEHSASVQKYKCIEKIREEIKQKSIAYEDFFE